MTFAQKNRCAGGIPGETFPFKGGTGASAFVSAGVVVEFRCMAFVSFPVVSPSQGLESVASGALSLTVAASSSA
jgi:hypothetical protein